jgi:hypothetical protein
MIDNPQAVKFVNEQVRVLAEELRALAPKLKAMETDWFGGISGLVPNDATLLDDGRDGEGVSRLTGADITSVVVVAQSLIAALNADGVPAVIAKPCVRPLRTE